LGKVVEVRTQKEELYRMIDALSEKRIIIAKRLLEKLLKKQALESHSSVGNEPSPQIKTAKGKDLLNFIGTIDKSDLEIMELAIKNGCERIDYAEW